MAAVDCGDRVLMVEPGLISVAAVIADNETSILFCAMQVFARVQVTILSPDDCLWASAMNCTSIKTLGPGACPRPEQTTGSLSCH